MKWIGLIATLALGIACFFPWVIIESKQFVITGMNAGEIRLGKPGYAHLFFAFLYLIFHFTPKIWAKRLNLLIPALNLAWAIRNFFLVSSCAAGECPVRQPALYILLAAAALMMLAAMFPDIKLKTGENATNM